MYVYCHRVGHRARYPTWVRYILHASNQPRLPSAHMYLYWHRVGQRARYPTWVRYIPHASYQPRLPSAHMYLNWHRGGHRARYPSWARYNLHGGTDVVNSILMRKWPFSWGHQRRWASYQIRKIAGSTCARNAGNVFPATDFTGNSQLTIPACITARASRTCCDACRDCYPVRSGGENITGIPGACATRNFAYLVRGPWCWIFRMNEFIYWTRNDSKW